MCTAFMPNSRYDNSIIKLIRNVYCPNTMCLDLFCVHKEHFQSLDTSDCQCFQCESMCQVGNILFQEQTDSFFLNFSQEMLMFEDTKKSIQFIVENMCCSTRPYEKCAHLSTNKNSNFYDCKICEACSHMLNNLKDQKRTITLFDGDGTHCFAKCTSCDYEKGNQFPLLKIYIQ